jgi:hypothetical protein
LHLVENPRVSLEGANGIFKNIEKSPKGPRFTQGAIGFGGVPLNTISNGKVENARTASADRDKPDRLTESIIKELAAAISARMHTRCGKLHYHDFRSAVRRYFWTVGRLEKWLTVASRELPRIVATDG